MLETCDFGHINNLRIGTFAKFDTYVLKNILLNSQMQMSHQMPSNVTMADGYLHMLNAMVNGTVPVKTGKMKVLNAVRSGRLIINFTFK